MGVNSVVSGNGTSPSHERRGEALRFSENLPYPYVVRPNIVAKSLELMSKLPEVHPYVERPEAEKMQVPGVKLDLPKQEQPQTTEALFATDSQHDKGAGAAGADPVSTSSPVFNPPQAAPQDDLRAIRDRISSAFN